MSPNAFDALSAGEKAHRAFVAVSQAANAQALRPGADDTGHALGHALGLLAAHVPASCWPAASELSPEGTDVFDQIAQRAAPQAGPGMSPTPRKAPGLAQAVTVSEPCTIGMAAMFAVRPGVPLDAASDELSLLLSTARDAAADLAILLSDTNPPTGTMGGSLAHPIAYLLDMACALQSSIHEGLKSAQRGGA